MSIKILLNRHCERKKCERILRGNFKCHLCLCFATLALWLAYNGEKGKLWHFLQMTYNDGGFAKQVLHFITVRFVDLRSRLFLMKQNLNFDKAKRKNLSKMMIKCE